ncbi:hypothetical protein G5C66_11370 [Nocardioides sp. KC13]|uniref:Uncharacterized protein n=1 Tax=Nocardioides turkmenicus TaxID=2711220 RepID=A0A6M1QZS2_9ACTN|nr:hypothetical protein [Nocardioides sp. KC13]NGN93336.1 hypothetical protein [Nocardioides sp. KC13]
MGVPDGSGSPVSGSLGDSVGSLGDPLGSLGLSVGDSLGDSLGSLGDSPGSLGVSLSTPVGRGSEGTWVGRAGVGYTVPPADSSTERGLAGTGSSISGASLPGAVWLGGRDWVGVEDDFSSGATGEIMLTPDSSVA